jgi:hypothetical protein
MIPLFVIMLIFVIVAAIVFIATKIITSQTAPTASALSPTAARPIVKQNFNSYAPVLSVKSLSDLAQNFVHDNPNGNGTDPTGGSVDYSFFMDTDKSKVSDSNPLGIVPNINGDIFWQNINLSNPNVSSLWKDNKDANGNVSSFSLNPSNDLLSSKNVGSYRVGSKRFFKGGLFVFDIASLPAACGTWPAIWLNGFVGAPNQYRFQANPVSSDNTSKMDKIFDSFQKSVTLQNIEFYGDAKTSSPTYMPRMCAPDEVLRATDFDETKDGDNYLAAGFDPYLSNYKGQRVYPAKWPAQGEIDIIETVNFDPSSTVSMHTGPYCRPSGSVPFKNQPPTPIIACGTTYDPLGLYSGCKAPLYGFGDQDAKEIVNGVSQASCTNSPGTTQIDVQFGTFGPKSLTGAGGVFVCQWIPASVINVWFFPYSSDAPNSFTPAQLSAPGWPLSSSPVPGPLWDPVLVANYKLTDPSQNMVGCDANFMEIVINLSFGGNWAGADGIFQNTGCCFDSCNTDDVMKNPSFSTYLNKCFGPDPPATCISKEGTTPYGNMSMNINGIYVYQNPATDDIL